MRWQSLMTELDRAAPDFELPDTNGRITSLRQVRGARGTLVAFICNHCPFVLHIIDELVLLAGQYSAMGIGAVAISSNDVEAYPEDGPQLMARFAEEHALCFPYLYDASQSVAKAYGAACTPDLFLYDAQGRLYYRGQFDASRPSTPHARAVHVPARGADLRDAADRLLAAAAPPPDQKPSTGCSMKWKPGNEPEWA